MKLFFASVFLIATATGPFSHASSLDPALAQEVLTQIDNACGDSWCESDFNFTFDSFECDFTLKQCTLGFRLYPLDRQDLLSSPQTCTLGPVASATDLLHGILEGILDGTYDERLVRLNPSFYEKVDSCLSAAITRQTGLLEGKY
jgi:hypothetical protein